MKHTKVANLVRSHMSVLDCFGRVREQKEFYHIYPQDFKGDIPLL